MNDQITEIRKTAKCVYLATEAEVADDIARVLNQAADALGQCQADVLHWKGMTKGRESEIDKHLARIEQLEAALRKYGDYEYECSVGQEPDFICNCGLSELIAGGSELPGTDKCSDDWHRNKFVSTECCPTCQMSRNEFNAQLRTVEDS